MTREENLSLTLLMKMLNALWLKFFLINLQNFVPSTHVLIQYFICFVGQKMEEEETVM